jgi:hypothetical protein
MEYTERDFTALTQFFEKMLGVWRYSDTTPQMLSKYLTAALSRQDSNLGFQFLQCLQPLFLSESQISLWQQSPEAQLVHIKNVRL